MTPYLSKLAIGAINEETVTRMWTHASLTRMKTMPKLDKLLNKTKQEQKPDVSARLKSALLGFKGKGGVPSPNQ
jgi:hypothetical protein